MDGYRHTLWWQAHEEAEEHAREERQREAEAMEYDAYMEDLMIAEGQKYGFADELGLNYYEVSWRETHFTGEIQNRGYVGGGRDGLL